MPPHALLFPIAGLTIAEIRRRNLAPDSRHIRFVGGLPPMAVLNHPLENIRVIDLGRHQAGPRCAQVLARMGPGVRLVVSGRRRYHPATGSADAGTAKVGHCHFVGRWNGANLF